MSSICIFCGSSPGTSPLITRAAQITGRILAERGITLVYGGGGRGLMTELADAALAAGGQVIGVIPRSMIEKEWAHSGLTDLRIVNTMHDRKALMAELADGFAVLPGGIGTLDEFFEIWTWWQLGLHAKPIGILNVDGFFDHLFTHMNRMVDGEFISPVHRDGLIITADPRDLIDRLSSRIHDPARPQTAP